jgi:hypothetical protein
MRQKALALLSGFRYIGRPIKINRNHGKFGGSLATLRDCFWRKEEPWGVVQLPSGKNAAVPLASTDIPREEWPVFIRSPQIDAMRLLELAKFCQQLPAKQHKSRRKSSRRK